MSSKNFQKLFGKPSEVSMPENPRFKELDEEEIESATVSEQRQSQRDGKRSASRFDESFVFDGMMFNSLLEFLNWMVANRDYVDLRKVKSLHGTVNGVELSEILTGSIGPIEEISSFHTSMVGVGVGQKYKVGKEVRTGFTIYTRIASWDRPGIRNLRDNVVLHPQVQVVKSTDLDKMKGMELQTFHGLLSEPQGFQRKLPVHVIDISDSDEEMTDAGGAVDFNTTSGTEEPVSQEPDLNTCSEEPKATDSKDQGGNNSGVQTPVVTEAEASVCEMVIEVNDNQGLNSEDYVQEKLTARAESARNNTAVEDTTGAGIATPEGASEKTIQSESRSVKRKHKEDGVGTPSEAAAENVAGSSKRHQRAKRSKASKTGSSKRLRDHTDDYEDISSDSGETLKSKLKKMKSDREGDNAKSKAKVSQDSEDEPGEIGAQSAPDACDAESLEFFDKECQFKWEFVVERKILAERTVDIVKFQECGFTSYLKQLKLLKAATQFGEYNKPLVMEFYSNLKAECEDEESQWYHRVYVRGKIVDFAPELINQYLGFRTVQSGQPVFQHQMPESYDAVAVELTGGVEKTWPVAGRQCITASHLTTRYYCLYLVAVNNWIPSVNTTSVTKDMATLLFSLGARYTVNIGKLIFNDIYDCAQKTRKEAMVHPSIITAVLQLGGASVRDTDEWIPVQVLKPTSRTLSGRIVKDLPWTPSAASGSGNSNAVQQARIMAINARVQVCQDLINKHQAIVDRHQAELAELNTERARMLNDARSAES